MKIVRGGGDLIKGLLPTRSFGLLIGPSGSGKTFLAGHVALCVSSKRDCLGQRVRGGPVAYVPAENPKSAETRFAAARSALDLPDDMPLAIIEGNIDMLAKGSFDELRARLVELHDEFGSIGLVVIDTASQAMPGGDENSSETMTAFVAACQALRQEFDCSVLVVHHVGKTVDRGARGHSSLRAAVDVELEVTDTGGYREVHVRKMRDGPTGLSIAFKLTPVSIGVDGDGDDMTTCVIEPSIDAPARSARPKGANQLLVFQALERCSSMFGRAPAGQPMSRIRVVRLDQLRDEAAKQEFGHMDAKHRATRIGEAITSLKATCFVNGDSEFIWIPPRFGTPESDPLTGGSGRAGPRKHPNTPDRGIRGIEEGSRDDC